MRVAKSLCVIAGLVFGLAAPALIAQLKGAPYSGIRKTTRVQTLADGTKITHETSIKEARDSAGRTYRERHPTSPDGVDNPDVVDVNIFDPVSRVTIHWSSQTKQATIFHMRDQEQVNSIPIIRPQGEENSSSSAPAPQIEHLGTQTINGVTVEGMRTTRVLPAGKVGNDRPITITREAWVSRELQLPLRESQNDPRTGLMTSELTDIQLSEPDASLFQIPEGYTVKEQFPTQN